MSITETAQAAQALSTLNQDGSRRWLRPRLSRGRFLNRRRAVGYGLIALFTVIPYMKLGGKPLILLDVPRREFTLFGMTFLPTDTLLLSLLVIAIFLLVFLLTALLGRVWCGWGCPQTVYLELVYRPIERFFEGAPGRQRRPTWLGGPGVRKGLKWATYVLVSMVLAHTFLAYFVGVERLAQWVQQSPLEHPASFLIMLSVTALMLFDLGFFREQMCIVACPYGRFQSVMLDRDTLIIGYDKRRGEPRGRVRRTKRVGRGVGAEGRGISADTIALPILDAAEETGARTGSAASRQGDCVDCMMCVQTCPTGIDIRDGLQMECIGCAQCIDACDAVMTKLGRARGLIRYSSQAAFDGRNRRVLRPRVIIYPLALAIILVIIVLTVLGRSGADVHVLRGPGMPYNVLPSGEVANQVRIKITNRTREPERYTIELLDPRLVLTAEENPMLVAPNEPRTQGALIVAPAGAFESGRLDVRVRISTDGGFSEEVVYRLLGPNSGPVDAGGTP